MTVSRRTVLKTLAATGAAGAAVGVAGRAEASHAAATLAPDAMGLLYDSTLCIGCQTCTVACQRANGMPVDKSLVTINGAPFDFPSDTNGYNKTVIKLFDSGERHAFMKMQCMQCVDPACTKACMLGSLHKVENGIVAWDPVRCTGCRYCQISCPFNVPKFQWHEAIPRIVKCELCRARVDGGKGSACAEVCPRGAVIAGKTVDLLATAKKRIAENPGRYYGEKDETGKVVPKIYGEHDGGGTQTLYLAPAGVSFQDLGLPKLTHEPPAQMAMTVQHGVYKGFIAPVILYVAAAVAIVRNLRKDAAEAHREEGKHS
ncbi:MAG TPA: hydrogenase 2 operon protein HybA [Anaeromyxobacteraceae bacterium]|nr:hydrogenase 2 operon protein HybA [Anaeromyxobacteraceae bacterium]